MILSIRTFLIINLLLTITIIISLAIITNIFLVQREVQLQLDTQLTITAKRLQAFLNGYNELTHQQNFALLQTHFPAMRNELPLSSISQIYKNMPHPNMEAPKQYVEFQIWDDKNQLLLRSPNAPLKRLNAERGLSTIKVDNQTWHINTLYDPVSKLTFIVAETSGYRERLVNQLTKSSILVMLITYPFLVLVIWIIVGRGLRVIERVTGEVRNRAPGFLKPVNLVAIPSEIRPLISELNHLFNQLQEAFDREQRFAADAAHELRTPLAALHMYTQIAVSSTTFEGREQALLKLLIGVNRCTHIVQQLLILSRMVPEAINNDLIGVDVKKEAIQVAANLAPEAIAKKIDLELLSIPEEGEFMINGNSGAISILIRNLVDNSIRYCYQKGKILIKIEKTANHVSLYIIDNGPGIPPELRQRVFERFFRVIGSKVSGSGLGLSIVSQVVRLHKAEILLKTPEGKRGLEVQIIFGIREETNLKKDNPDTHVEEAFLEEESEVENFNNVTDKAVTT